MAKFDSSSTVMLSSVKEFKVRMTFERDFVQPLAQDIPYFNDLHELDVPPCEVRSFDVTAKHAVFASNIHKTAHPVRHAHVAELLKRKRNGKRGLLSTKKPNFVLVLDKHFRRVWWRYWWVSSAQWDSLVVMPPLTVLEPSRLIVC